MTTKTSIDGFLCVSTMSIRCATRSNDLTTTQKQGSNTKHLKMCSFLSGKKTSKRVLNIVNINCFKSSCKHCRHSFTITFTKSYEMKIKHKSLHCGNLQNCLRYVQSCAHRMFQRNFVFIKTQSQYQGKCLPHTYTHAHKHPAPSI